MPVKSIENYEVMISNNRILPTYESQGVNITTVRIFIPRQIKKLTLLKKIHQVNYLFLDNPLTLPKFA